AATAAGLGWRRRQGAVRAVGPTAVRSRRAGMLAAVGIGIGGAPVVLHFAADWCGPCAAVRRVVAQVVANLPDPGARDLELDFDEHRELAAELGVRSLPTTFIFDSDGIERFRISGVPNAADLHRALAGPATGK
ncbi:MAG: thioredoxin family protein, partial [Mycobacteriaceae bacterium]|nr:thioredoxin family protein [Mycobacteriaceae bacterium]